jgi:hypothetical protein
VPQIGGVLVVGMGLEDPARRTAIHRHEPGPVAELGPSTGHRTDLALISAILLDELD